jgi:hypothetical protein
MKAEDFLNDYFEELGFDIDELEKDEIVEVMEAYVIHQQQVQKYLIAGVVKCYTTQDMDDCYDKGFSDGCQRDRE